MRSIALIAYTAITFAASVFAVPGHTGFSPKNSLVKRGGLGSWTPVQLWPEYPGNFTAWKPIGCYSSDVGLTYNTGMCSCQNPGWNKQGAMPFSMQKCFALCKGAGFRYAGIKGDSGVKACWCGNGVSDDSKLSSEAKCDVPCGEDEGNGIYDTSKCGGKTTYTVWKDPCYGDFDGEAEIGNYEYIGCFYYEGSPFMPYWIGTVSDNLSIDSCIEHCSGLGFAYASMAASGDNCWIGNQCHCGGKIAKLYVDRHNAYPADNNGCTSLCSATAKVQWSIDKADYQYCGQCWYASVYFNANLAEPEVCNAGPPKETVTVTTPGPTPGTTTIPGTSTDTVVITTPVEKTTVTTTVTGTEPGTSTKTGPTTDSVIITETAPHFTVTTTVTNDEPGTTTKTGSKTDTVIITVTPDVIPTQATVTRTTPGPEPGTETIFVTDDNGDTITTSGTVSIIITTPTKKPTQATVTRTTPGPSPGTETIFVTDDNGDTITTSGTVSIIITTPTKKPTQATVTRTTPGPSPGTETIFVTDDNGDTITTSGTVSIIITTPTQAAYTTHATVTTTVTADEPGTTTKTGSKTDTVIITVTPDVVPTQATVTRTTPGPSPGTETIFVTDDNGDTITTSGTVSIIITTPTQAAYTTHATVTTTVTADEPGTTTKTGSKTDTVIITVTPDGPEPASEHPTTTITTPGTTPGTTTVTGPETDTVIITKPTEPAYSTHATVTTTVTNDEPGTTTKTGSKTDTVIITVTPDSPDGPSSSPEIPTDGPSSTPEAPTGKITITTTVSGTKPGTTLIPGSKTDTVRITTTPSGPGPQSVTKTTVTVTTPGPTPGTTTIPGDKTVSIIITTKTGGDTPPPTGTPPNDSCCIMASPSNSDKKMGLNYPLGGVKPSTVWTPNKASFILVRLTGITTNCRTSYKYTIQEFQAACWNGCMEQQKKCYVDYASKTDVCTGSGKKKKCFSKQELKSQCDTQYNACKLANTNTNKKKNPLKDAMDKCGAAPPEDDGYGDDGYYRM